MGTTWDFIRLGFVGLAGILDNVVVIRCVPIGFSIATVHSAM
jgi:hypothetical protein